VSRAYYGAFHVALRLLASLGVSLSRSAAAHDKAAICLQHGEDEGLSEAGLNLISLREMRNLADYRLDDKRFTNSKFVALQIGEAEGVIATISRAEQNPTAIRGPIRDYARSVLRLAVRGAD
jgi:hypothetical protein